MMNRAAHIESIAEDLERDLHQETPAWIRTTANKLKSLFSWIPDLWSWVKNVIQIVICVVVLLVALGICVKCCSCLKVYLKLCKCNCKSKIREQHVKEMYQEGYNVYGEESMV